MYLRPLLCLISVFMLVNVAGAAPFAYVTNAGTGTGVDTVTVIDTADNTVAKTVSINHPTIPGNSTHPYGVAISQDGRYAYVSNQLSKTISVINATTTDSTVVKTVTLTFKPSGLAVNPAGTRLYVTNSDAAGVVVLNTASILAAGGSTVTGASVQVGSVTVGNGPIYVVVNAAGTKAYVSNSGSNNVSVLSANDATNAYAKVKDITVGSNPSGMALNNTANKLYVTNMFGDSVSIINTSTDTLGNTVTLTDCGNPVAAAVDGAGVVYVSCGGSDRVGIIDANDTLLTSPAIYTGPGPFGIAVKPGSNQIYVANQFTPNGAPGTVDLFATDTGYNVGTVNVGTNPQAFGSFIGPVMYPITVTSTTNGTVAPAGGTADNKFYVVGGGSQSFTITPASGYIIDSVVKDGVSDPLKPSSVSFSNVNESHTLDIAFFIDFWNLIIIKDSVAGATGTVVSTPGGISCGSTCSGRFGKGTSLTLTATPDPGFGFTGWTGCPNAVGNVCTISNLSADTTIHATFGSMGGPVKVWSTGMFYSLVQAGYDALSSSTDLTVNTDYVGNEALNLVRSDTALVINLKGGYNSDHSAGGGAPTKISGLVVGGNGASGTTLIIDNILISP